MLIPRYWAEAQARHQNHHRHWVTVRRAGWSDTSPADAARHAQERLQHALARRQAGANEPAREPRVPYNGADGMPIREEIVARQGNAIVTRNSYGARCLNTPDVLFADIDLPHPASASLGCQPLLMLAALSVAAPMAYATGHAPLAAVALGLMVALAVWQWLQLRRQRHALARPVQEQAALARVHAFAQSRPAWGLRIYRTPAGLRVLVTHQRFAPDDPAVSECFEALGVDPTYRRMCLRQRCFRARVSAKPWRMGMTGRIRPGTGAWPVAPEDEGPRAAWVARYEAAARGHAACAFMHALGAPLTDTHVQPVLDWHDELCQAHSALPLA
ncbi:MAG: hypothetical protein Q4D74_02320 [Comamonadaceae bacterium]|nr:hypothetical protein [Comamonadaceae bacterium]